MKYVTEYRDAALVGATLREIGRDRPFRDSNRRHHAANVIRRFPTAASTSLKRAQRAFQYARKGFVVQRTRSRLGRSIARDIATTGNTSAASVPLATERLLREGEAPRGGLALQLGFGLFDHLAAEVWGLALKTVLQSRFENGNRFGDEFTRVRR